MAFIAVTKIATTTLTTNANTGEPSFRCTVLKISCIQLQQLVFINELLKSRFLLIQSSAFSIRLVKFYMFVNGKPWEPIFLVCDPK